VKTRLCMPLAVLVLTACGNPDTQVSTNIASPVSVEDIQPKMIEEYITATGTVSATAEVLLKAESSGYYRLAINPQTSRLFVMGDRVKKGTIIVYIDNPEQENTIRIKSQELTLDISKREYEKQKSLYEKGGVTLHELKNAEKALIDAQYSYDNAMIQLSKLRITAPFDGVIIDLPYYTPGNKIDSGAEMVHLMNYEKLTMETQLPGRHLGRVIPRQPVRVTNYTLPDKIFNGSITQVSPALDPETRSFKATIAVDNPDLLLRPGMFVKSEVVVSQADSTIVIPKNIILTRRNNKIVFVVERGTSVERTIETGLENPDEVQITKGLEIGERLVVGGYETLRNRSAVKIIQ